MRPIPLAERIGRTGLLFYPLQSKYGYLPIAAFCEFMAEELGQPDYLDFLETLEQSYGADLIPLTTVKTAMREARKVLWDHEFTGAVGSRVELQRAERTLYMLLVRPFLVLEQQENNPNH